MDNNKRLNFRIVLVIVAIVFVALAIGGVVYSNSPAYKLGKQLALGEKYLNNLDYKEAVAMFSEALAIDPKNERALQGLETSYYEWAYAYADKEDYDKASEILEEALGVLPKSKKISEQSADIYGEWAQMYYEKGDIKEAARIAREGSELSGDDDLLAKAELYDGEASGSTDTRSEAGDNSSGDLNTSDAQQAVDNTETAQEISKELETAQKAWGTSDLTEYVDPKYGVHFFIPSDITLTPKTPFYNMDIAVAYYATGRGMNDEFLLQVQKAPANMGGDSIEDELYGKIAAKDGYEYSINFPNPDTQYDLVLSSSMEQFIRTYRQTILSTAYVE